MTIVEAQAKKKCLKYYSVTFYSKEYFETLLRVCTDFLYLPWGYFPRIYCVSGNQQIRSQKFLRA
jgi:hypothetical protein